MLTISEEDYIRKYAYIPEHITGYVISISRGEPFLFKDYLSYNIKDHLVFIGYPLNKPFQESEMKETLDSAVERFKPDHVALIAPLITIPGNRCLKKDSDHYYRLDLSDFRLNQKLRNMITRASRELDIERNKGPQDEHIQLISEFLNSHKVDDDTRYIFERIPEYLTSVPTAWVFSARDKGGKLVAFDIVDFGSRDYAFYMFNFMSLKYRIPGASDLLLNEIIKTAKDEGKPFINLGLGINEGIRFFKEKWGGKPFINYEYCFYQRTRTDRLKSLFERF
jgi:hypothetical protein